MHFIPRLTHVVMHSQYNAIFKLRLMQLVLQWFWWIHDNTVFFFFFKYSAQFLSSCSENTMTGGSLFWLFEPVRSPQHVSSWRQQRRQSCGVLPEPVRLWRRRCNHSHIPSESAGRWHEVTACPRQPVATVPVVVFPILSPGLDKPQLSWRPSRTSSMCMCACAGPSCRLPCSYLQSVRSLSVGG